MAHKTNQQQIRLQLAQEAARIILAEGVRDYQLAKRKASQRLRIGDRLMLPSNIEVDEAIRNHQALFFTEEDYFNQLILWRAAKTAMLFLKDFTPRLVGPVLNGTAGRHSIVNLHVFSDAFEEVLLLFLNSGIPYQSSERRIRISLDYKTYPMICHIAENVEFETVVLPYKAMRDIPLSAIDGRPIKRAGLNEVEKKIQSLSNYNRT